jgi:hypothetical protein
MIIRVSPEYVSGYCKRVIKINNTEKLSRKLLYTIWFAVIKARHP